MAVQVVGMVSAALCRWIPSRKWQLASERYQIISYYESRKVININAEKQVEVVEGTSKHSIKGTKIDSFKLSCPSIFSFLICQKKEKKEKALTSSLSLSLSLYVIRRERYVAGYSLSSYFLLLKEHKHWEDCVRPTQYKLKGGA